MNTPTPRTDSAWAKTFQDDEDQCRAGNAATDMRDECATLERELATITAERDRWQEIAQTASAEREHNANVASAAIAERDQLRSAIAEMPTCRCDRSTEQQCELSAKVATLTAERDELRAEVERLTSDRDCEKRLRKDADEFRENVIERAERAEAELAAERARLDWLGDNVEEIYRERDQRGSCVYLSGENIRAAIDAAMKEGK